MKAKEIKFKGYEKDILNQLALLEFKKPVHKRLKTGDLINILNVKVKGQWWKYQRN